MISRCDRGVAPGFDWARWLESGHWARDAQTLKHDAESSILAVRTPSGLDSLPDLRAGLVIKVRAATGALETLKRAAGASRGIRQWRGAEWLRTHGFQSAAPLALARARVQGRVCELLILQRLSGPTVLEVASLATGGSRSGEKEAGWSAREEHAVAKACGQHVAGLVRAGRYNRDGKPSNLIVTGLPRRGRGMRAGREVPPAEQVGISVIDTVAIRRIVGGRTRALEGMLARLYIEPLGCGTPPRRALCMRAVQQAVLELHGQVVKRHVHGVWRRAARLVQGHGDPTPRVMPGRGHEPGHRTSARGNTV